MKLRYHKKGFTLLELMIVVIIVGILASLALPRFIRATKKAESAEALTTLGQLRSSEWRYYYESDTFTTDIDQLDIDNPNNIPNKKFTYSVTAASAAAVTIQSVHDDDANIIITIDEDGNISRSGI